MDGSGHILGMMLTNVQIRPFGPVCPKCPRPQWDTIQIFKGLVDVRECPKCPCPFAGQRESF